MEKKREQQWDDNFIEQMMAESFGYSDEQLAEELDQIALETGKTVPEAPEGEFEKIWERVDRKDHKPERRRRIRIRRVVKMMVAAALLGAMVLSGGSWVGARKTREYEERIRADRNDMLIFNSGSDNVIMSVDTNAEEAYEQIEEELGIQILELSYLPEKMSFYKLRIQKRSGVMEFVWDNNSLFFYQGLNNNTSSLSYVSDMEEVQIVYNSFLGREIPIYQKSLENGEVELGTQIIENDQYYFLHGIIEIKEFNEIVCGIKYRK